MTLDLLNKTALQVVFLVEPLKYKKVQAMIEISPLFVYDFLTPLLIRYRKKEDKDLLAFCKSLPFITTDITKLGEYERKQAELIIAKMIKIYHEISI